MAKKKGRKSKRKLSEKVVERKSISENRTNPFELKINRQKHAILGRKEKHSKGVPGVARSKAVTKRKSTLLLEFQRRNKSNKFIDKRIGEYDSNLTPDDKMLARFAIERKSHHEKGSIFNLNDDEELTHFGQSLAEIEKFDDPKSDSENEDERLGDEFVKGAHFGGLLVKKDSTDNEAKEETKSRKDLIDELIAKSKQLKHDRQMDRENTIELTEKLDNEWKNVRNLLSSLKVAKGDEGGKTNLDSYDLMVREMKYEMRAKPTNRLKTPDEIAKEEKEKLERLETERLKRMQVDAVELHKHNEKNTTVETHYSADGLYDGLKLKNDEEKFCVSYKDGKLLHQPNNGPPNYRDGQLSVVKETGYCVDKEDAGESGASDSDDAESDTESEASDVSSDELENETDDTVEEKDAPSRTLLKKTHHLRKSELESENSPRMKELPYVFQAPNSFEEFLEMMEGYTTKDQLTIVDRIIKCHHPCLAEKNREKMEAFFPMLLQLVNDAVSQDVADLELVDGLVPHLYTLTQFSPQNSSSCMLDVILEKHENFHKECSSHANNKTRFPYLDTIIFFKLVALLFPTSDFQHSVVTPTMLFMGQILVQCTIHTVRDIIVGLFICNLFCEYVTISKRFVPEAINFLRSVYYSALHKEATEKSLFIHPFKSTDPGIHLLELENDCRDLTKVQHLSLKQLNFCEEISDELRITIMSVCLHIVHQFAKLYETLPSYQEIFVNFVEWRHKFPLEKCPEDLKSKMDMLMEQLQKGSSRRQNVLIQEKKKPQPLKLLEPKIEERFDGRKHKKGNKTTLEKQKLLHKYKRELKGAVREIRRDNQFLAKQKLEEQLERDNERKRKLKELYHDLSVQEGHCKSIERLKRKK